MFEEFYGGFKVVSRVFQGNTRCLGGFRWFKGSLCMVSGGFRLLSGFQGVTRRFKMFQKVSKDFKETFREGHRGFPRLYRMFQGISGGVS